MSEVNCTLLVSVPDKAGGISGGDTNVHADMESPELDRKIAGLKKAITMLLSGEDSPRMMMTVIRYCITQEDHTLQKLLMYYWEVARKYDASGKLLPELILVWYVLGDVSLSYESRY